MQAYSGPVALGFHGLVCAVRPAVEFCEWAAPLVPTIMGCHRAMPKDQVRKGAGGLRYGFSCSHRDHSTALGLTGGADRQAKKGGP